MCHLPTNVACRFSRVSNGRIDIGAFESQTLSLEVDNSGDIIDGDYSDGELTLREAIMLTNANPGPDAITFDPSLSGEVITLVSGELEITDSVTIDASSLTQNLIIDADNASRVMNFSATSGDLTLRNLELKNGYTTLSGGGIHFNSRDTLTLEDSTFSGNSANYGGGIYNFGTATITNSTLSGNSAAFRGGGIHNSGTATITNSTLSGNYSALDGGGIFNEGGTATITNSTLSGNSAHSGGGGIFNNGTTTITNSTLSGNSASVGGGGGILNFGTTTITNSIVANSDGGDIVIAAGDIDGNSSYNLIEDATDNGGLSHGSNGNIVGQDPMLGELGSNGGPTKTHALMTGSPAIDAGDPAAASGVDIASTDQRGVSRIFGRLDIGAVESAILDINSDSNWILRRQAADNSLLEFEFGSPSVVQVLGPLSAFANLLVAFNGIDGNDDTLTIDYTNGFFEFADGISFLGNTADNDELRVIGGSTGLMRAEYFSADAGLGTASVETRLGAQSNTISFSDLKILDFDELLSFEVDGLLDIGDNTLEVDATVSQLDTLTLIDGGTFTVPGGLTLGAGQLLQGHGTVAGPFFGAAGSLINVTGTDSTLAIGDANHFGGFATEGRVTVNNGSTLQLFDRDKSVLGAYTLLDNATLATGEILVDDMGPHEADGPGVLLANGDVIEVVGNSVVRTNGSLDEPGFEVDGLVSIDTNGGLSVFGCLTGDQNLFEGGLLTLETCANPGGSSITGTSTFDFLNLTNSNQTIMQLGGLERGTEYDALDVTGLAELDGNLHLGLVDGFQPEVGQQFALIAGQHTGQFSSVTLGPTFDAFDSVGIEIRYDQPGMVLLEIRPPDPICDFDADGACGGSDIDRLQSELVNGSGDLAYDLNGDGLVTLADRDEWLALAGAENLPSGLPYLPADANLDGQVDASDFNVWNANKFSLTSDWTAGDFTADGQVDASDFNVWNGNKFFASESPGASAIVTLPFVLGRDGPDIERSISLRSRSLGRNSQWSDGRRERVERESVVDMIFGEFNR